MKQKLISFTAGIIIGIALYIVFDKQLTKEAVVVTETAGTELYSGTLSDADAVHVATGEFTITAEKGGERRINFSDMFSIVNAPDAYVMINSEFVSKVVNISGAQSYPIPNYIDKNITDVRVWCRIAGVSLAHSTLMDDGMMMDIEQDVEMDSDMEMEDEMGEPEMDSSEAKQ